MPYLLIVTQFLLDGFNGFFYLFAVVEVYMPEYSVGLHTMSEILSMIMTMMPFIILMPVLDVSSNLGVYVSIVIKKVDTLL